MHNHGNHLLRGTAKLNVNDILMNFYQPITGVFFTKADVGDIAIDHFTSPNLVWALFTVCASPIPNYPTIGLLPLWNSSNYFVVAGDISLATLHTVDPLELLCNFATI